MKMKATMKKMNDNVKKLAKKAIGKKKGCK